MTQSTINPVVPAIGADIASQPIRDNFAAAYNDINNIYDLISQIDNISNNQIFDFTGFIETPSDKVYTIIYNADFGGTINATKTISASGTATATFKINTTEIGGSANSVSSSGDSVVRSSDNTFVVGDKITITISSNSACADLSFTVKYTRILP